MTTFTIDAEHRITAYVNKAAAQSAVASGATAFCTADEWQALAATWSLARLVAVWNTLVGTAGLADLAPVKKFENRTVALRRIWSALELLAPTVPAVEESDDEPAPVHAPEPAEEARRTKADMVLALVQRSNGATLQELMAATGWQAHSVRGFLSGTLRKKRGLYVAYERETSRYRVRKDGNG